MRRNEHSVPNNAVSLTTTGSSANQIRRTKRLIGLTQLGDNQNDHAVVDNYRVQANHQLHHVIHTTNRLPHTATPDDRNVRTPPGRVRNHTCHQYRLRRQQTQLLEQRNTSQR